jgi:uncharacterized protein
VLKTSVVALVVVASLAEIAGGQAIMNVGATGPEIMASGRGETKATPTSSLVAISVTTRAATAAQAAADNATRLESTLRALRALGIAPADLTTMGYSVGQNYEMTRESRTPSGFIARNTIRAEVRKLEDIGKVIDAALAGGASEIAGVQYASANSQEARRSALAAAVREARADAETIARAAGGSLGTLITLSSGSSPQFREMAFDGDFAMAAGRATNIMPRDLTIAAQVVGRWQFVPGAGR